MSNMWYGTGRTRFGCGLLGDSRDRHREKQSDAHERGERARMAHAHRGTSTVRRPARRDSSSNLTPGREAHRDAATAAVTRRPAKRVPRAAFEARAEVVRAAVIGTGHGSRPPSSECPL